MNTGQTQPPSKWDDSEFHQHAQPSWWSRHRRALAAYVGLGLCVILVIFWLPDFIAPAPTTSSNDSVMEKALPAAAGRSDTPTSTSTTIESPFDQAQLQRARREAQEILAKVLDRQTTLEDKNILLWDAQRYGAALDTAKLGDEYYTAKQFDLALQQYRSTLEQLDELIQQSQHVLAQTLEQGEQALLDQDSNTATAAFELALSIDADNKTAADGLARAKVLDEVLALLDQSTNLMTTDLDQALAITEQALSLDPLSEPALLQKESLQSAIADRDYALAMGQGLEQLQLKQFQRALAAFKQALVIKPGDNHASTMIKTAQSGQQQYRIEQHLVKANESEENEQWSEAAEHYQKTLALDASLMSARIGKLRSEARSTLDQQLKKLLSDPLRLNDNQVLTHAHNVLADAQKVRPQGDLLRKQIVALKTAIDQSQQPVPVQLQSDNATQVTLFRVGPLGSFNQQQLELTPGRYTLVGNRPGYRDVREEFTVTPGAQSLSVVIQCTERIALDG